MADVGHLHFGPIKFPALILGQLLTVLKKVPTPLQSDFPLPICVIGGIEVSRFGTIAGVRQPQIDCHRSAQHLFESIILLKILGQLSKSVAPIPVQSGKWVCSRIRGNHSFGRDRFHRQNGQEDNDPASYPPPL